MNTTRPPRGATTRPDRRLHRAMIGLAASLAFVGVASPAMAATPVTDEDRFCSAFTAMALSTELSQMAASLPTLQAAAPREIAEPVDVLVATVRRAIDSQGTDIPSPSDPKMVKARDVIAPWVYGHCPFPLAVQVRVEASGLSGVPDRIPAGLTGLLLSHDGNEDTEVVLYRRLPGVTMSWDEILALDPAAREARATATDIAELVADGDQAIFVLAFEPGEYALTLHSGTYAVITVS